jgi:hypothetical protein
MRNVLAAVAILLVFVLLMAVPPGCKTTKTTLPTGEVITETTMDLAALQAGVEVAKLALAEWKALRAEEQAKDAANYERTLADRQRAYDLAISLYNQYKAKDPATVAAVKAAVAVPKK